MDITPNLHQMWLRSHLASGLDWHSSGDPEPPGANTQDLYLWRLPDIKCVKSEQNRLREMGNREQKQSKAFSLLTK